MTLNVPSGSSTSMFFRLCSVAPSYPQPVTVAGTPAGRHIDGARAGQVARGERGAAGQDLLQRPGRGHPAAVYARPGSEINDVVGDAQGLLVVLHHDQGVAEVAQVDQRVQEALVVALMQPDGRFVEDVQHADQGRADLGGQPDALRFAARKGGRPPVERQVLQPHAGHERQPVTHLLENLRGNVALGVAEPDTGKECGRLLHAHARHLVDVARPAVRIESYRQRLGAQPGAAAAAAVVVPHVLLEPVLHALRGAVPIAAAQVVENAAIARGVAVAAAAPGIAVVHLHLFAGAVQQHVDDVRREAAERRVEIEIEVIRQRLEHAAMPGGVGIVGSNAALVEAEPRIGNDQRGVELHLHAQAGTVRARAERIVETEQARLEVRKRGAALAARTALGKLPQRRFAPAPVGGRGGAVARRRAVAGAATAARLRRLAPGSHRQRRTARRIDNRRHPSGPQFQRRLDRFRQPLVGLRADHYPVDHQLQ